MVAATTENVFVTKDGVEQIAPHQHVMIQHAAATEPVPMGNVSVIKAGLALTVPPLLVTIQRVEDMELVPTESVFVIQDTMDQIVEISIHVQPIHHALVMVCVPLLVETLVNATLDMMALHVANWTTVETHLALAGEFAMVANVLVIPSFLVLNVPHVL